MAHYFFKKRKDWERSDRLYKIICVNCVRDDSSARMLFYVNWQPSSQYYKTIFAVIELPQNYGKILMHYFRHLMGLYL